MLRLYQEEIIKNTRNILQCGTRTVLIQAPCGAGKTMLTASMLRTSQQRDIPSMFLCHRRELIKQTHVAFNKLNIGHGVIGAGFNFSPRPLVQIGSIQTVKNYIHKIRKPGLIVFDECHHLAAKSWEKIYNAFPNAFIIGLTATPERLDGTGLKKYFPVMVKGPNVQWLIDNGFLSKYKLFAPSNVDISNVHTRMGDFVSSELSAAIDKPTITGDAIKEYQKLASGKRAIVRGVSIEHSKHIAEQFIKAGISAQHVDGKTPPHIRDAAMESFRRGDTLVLSNVDLFGEGLDVPAVECVIDLRPTKSMTLWLQFCGRALRPHPDKEYAIIIDHAGNSIRHGLPCDDHQWSLEGRIKKPKEDTGPMIRLCPKCFGANQNWRKACQYCGTGFIASPREVEHKEGELAEVDVIKLRRERLRRQASCNTLDELIAFGESMGYPKAKWWAKKVWEARKESEIEKERSESKARNDKLPQKKGWDW